MVVSTRNSGTPTGTSNGLVFVDETKRYTADTIATMVGAALAEINGKISQMSTEIIRLCIDPVSALSVLFSRVGSTTLDDKVIVTLSRLKVETLEQTFNRLQAIVSHLEFMGVDIKQDDLNQMFLTSLAPEWLMYTIMWRNRDDLDTMSLNDVYNHLKVYKPEVQKKSESSSQNMAFISSAKTSSRKGEVNTDSIPTANTQVSPASTDVAAASISHDTVSAYIASQSNGSQIKYEDINQIDEDDIEEMDINYMANEEENHALVADDEAPTEFALMAKSSLSSENEEVRDLIRTRRVLDTVLFPPPAQVYSLPKKDMSWTGLSEFADDTIIDYSRPSPSIESNTSDLQNSNASVFEHGESSDSIMSKPMIKFVKASDSPTVIKTNKTETARKLPVKYAEMYKNTSKSPKVRGSGKITGKGIIKTGKLAFENVYFVKDLKYNLFSVSQICDNKNSVLFTDSECIVLEKDFKLKDGTNVLLRTPRQHNIYSINLTNIVSHKDLTCLVAKASADERKQHKASCKTKLVNSMSKPLHTLHMDLFGPTSVSSLNNKWCDNEGEFKNKEMNEFSNRKWTKREFSNARTPQQNGVAERRNRTLIEAARTMLADAKLPVTFWAEAVNTAWKFDAKGDEGYFIRYSMSSKAFRVFNKRTKKVGENLHVDFLENKLIEKGAGPNWLFDIDTLTNSMNYVPVVVAGTSSTNISGTKDIASQGVKKDVSSLRYIALPNCSPVPTASLDNSPETSSDTRLISKGVTSQEETPSLDNILTLSNRFEDILGDTTNTVDTNRVKADLSNMESIIPVSPTPTLRIHKDHPKSQIIGPVDTLKEPKKIFDALKDPSWVEAMQEELLQFKIQNVWILVDCPKGVRPIGTKWVLKNKKDEMVFFFMLKIVETRA
uniref:Retroviral polymerase SH3-like domain-containing protein n=1 Tax=Tanacetum cinerariifolium TaxID=118510 RepID=A0A6L2K5E0_TANCI|nr:hypothetical protein [Tanacetum cinerariifolium]